MPPSKKTKVDLSLSDNIYGLTLEIMNVCVGGESEF